MCDFGVGVDVSRKIVRGVARGDVVGKWEGEGVENEGEGKGEGR